MRSAAAAGAAAQAASPVGETGVVERVIDLLCPRNLPLDVAVTPVLYEAGSLPDPPAGAFEPTANLRVVAYNLLIAGLLAGIPNRTPTRWREAAVAQFRQLMGFMHEARDEVAESEAKAAGNEAEAVSFSSGETAPAGGTLATPLEALFPELAVASYASSAEALPVSSADKAGAKGTATAPMAHAGDGPVGAAAACSGGRRREQLTQAAASTEQELRRVLGAPPPTAAPPAASVAPPAASPPASPPAPAAAQLPLEILRAANEMLSARGLPAAPSEIAALSLAPRQPSLYCGDVLVIRDPLSGHVRTRALAVSRPGPAAADLVPRQTIRRTPVETYLDKTCLVAALRVSEALLALGAGGDAAGAVTGAAGSGIGGAPGGGKTAAAAASGSGGAGASSAGAASRGLSAHLGTGAAEPSFVDAAAENCRNDFRSDSPSLPHAPSASGGAYRALTRQTEAAVIEVAAGPSPTRWLVQLGIAFRLILATSNHCIGRNALILMHEALAQLPDGVCENAGPVLHRLLLRHFPHYPAHAGSVESGTVPIDLYTKVATLLARRCSADDPCRPIVSEIIGDLLTRITFAPPEAAAEFALAAAPMVQFAGIVNARHASRWAALAKQLLTESPALASMCCGLRLTLALLRAVPGPLLGTAFQKSIAQDVLRAYKSLPEALETDRWRVAQQQNFAELGDSGVSGTVPGQEPNLHAAVLANMLACLRDALPPSATLAPLLVPAPMVEENRIRLDRVMRLLEMRA